MKWGKIKIQANRKAVIPYLTSPIFSNQYRMHFTKNAYLSECNPSFLKNKTKSKTPTASPKCDIPFQNQGLAFLTDESLTLVLLH